MKKLVFLLSLSLAAASAQASQFVAAWDFTSPSGFTSLDVDGDFAADTSLSADYSGSGTFAWSGVTDDASGFFPGANLSSNTDDAVANDSGLTSLGEGSGFKVYGNTDSSAVLTLSGLDFTGLESASFTFASQVENNNGGATITLGGSLSGTVGIDGTDSKYTVDASALDGNSNASFTLSFSNFSGTENILLDNFQITATAVPEPSTYAAIFGAIALVIAIRRRK